MKNEITEDYGSYRKTREEIIKKLKRDNEKAIRQSLQLVKKTNKPVGNKNRESEKT